MQHTSLKSLWVRTVALSLVAGVCMGGAGDAWPVPQTQAAGSPSSEKDALSESPVVLRSRPLAFDVEDLTERALHRLDTVRLDLFDDASFTAIVDRVELRSRTSYSLVGTILGERGSGFALAVENGAVAANIRLPGRGEHYQILSTAEGGYAAYQIDDSAFPPCATHAGLMPPIPADAVAAVAGRGDCDDDGSVIDVMVVYTPLARQYVGGTDAINALINLAVTESNTAYTNSLVNTQLNLVYTGMVYYDESGSYVDHLLRLTHTQDGFMDDLHPLRDAHTADVVVLIVNDYSSCGIAWIMTDPLGEDFEGYAFSVVSRLCAVAQDTFAHEIGHNMGCAHDRANAVGPGMYDYSYGYQDPLEGFRTIMAYDCPGSCPRINYFSNPDVNDPYYDRPTGVPVGEPDAAHNALTINNTASILANCRKRMDCNDNGVCDATDIADMTSDDCNENGVPDECEYDCNDSGVPDDCDIAVGTSQDLNANGIPDECEHCPIAAPEPDRLNLPADPISRKVRYLSFAGGEVGRWQGIRVTFQNVPAPYAHWNGTQLWVQEPERYCENAGQKAVPSPASPPNYGCGSSGSITPVWFWGAGLGCDPYYNDWTQYGVVHVWNQGVIPLGVYDVQAIDETCALDDEANYSPALTLTESRWADLISNCTTNPCGPPDNSTGIVDVTAVLDKWKNLPGNVSKARADIEGSPSGDHRLPDQAVNITDVTFCLGAFLGQTYPPPGFPAAGNPPVCP